MDLTGLDPDGQLDGSALSSAVGNLAATVTATLTGGNGFSINPVPGSPTYSTVAAAPSGISGTTVLFLGMAAVVLYLVFKDQ